MTPMQKAVNAMRLAFDYSRGAHPDDDWAAALTAALSALEAEGWKLMPREATEEMLLEAGPGPHPQYMRNFYTAMTAVAPKPE